MKINKTRRIKPSLDNAAYFALGANLRKWTNSAKYCYSIGCQCSKCEIMQIVEMIPEECKMRYHVMELVKRLGKPEEETEEGNNENIK